METNKKILQCIDYHTKCATDFFVIVKSMEDCKTKWHTQNLMYAMFYASLFSKRKYEIDLLLHQYRKLQVDFIKDQKKLYFAHVVLKKLLEKMAEKCGIYTTPALKENSKLLPKAILHDLAQLQKMLENITNQDFDYLHKVAYYLELCNKNMNEIICVV